MSPRTLTIALAGNPNSGKTTIFNNLTGAHQKVGNWSGVTDSTVSNFGYHIVGLSQQFWSCVEFADQCDSSGKCIVSRATNSL